jgi:integral membrane sensor domain MASE1
MVPNYLYVVSAASSFACGTVFGMRQRSFKDGLTAALICATGISCFLSLRYVEMAIFWLFGSPAAGLKLLGTMFLIALPWLLFQSDKKLAVISAVCVAAAAACLWIQPSHFPFPVVYASVILSSATRIALELRPSEPNP